MSDNMAWFRKLLPPKNKARKGSIKAGETEIEKGKFRPHLSYDRDHGCLDVRILGCPSREVNTCPAFSVSETVDRKKNVIAMFTFWSVKSALYDEGYRKESISLEKLIDIFKRHNPQSVRMGVYGQYEEQIRAIARKHQFVWHLDK